MGVVKIVYTLKSYFKNMEFVIEDTDSLDKIWLSFKVDEKWGRVETSYRDSVVAGWEIKLCQEIAKEIERLSLQKEIEEMIENN